MALALTSANALSSQIVLAHFNSPLANLPATFNPSNYVITSLSSPPGPSPVVLKVLFEEIANNVRLIVSGLTYDKYQLQVSNVQNEFGDIIPPVIGGGGGGGIDIGPGEGEGEGGGGGNTVTFTGWSENARFTVNTIAENVIQVLFAQEMAASSALSDPTSYTVVDLQGNPILVVSATPNEVSGALRVRLVLQANLTPSNTYVVSVSEDVLTLTGLSLLPPTGLTTWNRAPKSRSKVSISLGRFTGEVRAPKILNREAIERLNLSESLTATVETSRGFRNTTAQHEDLVDYLGTLRVTNFIESHEDLSGGDISSVVYDDYVYGSVRLSTDVRPFDPARPDFVHLGNLTLSEGLAVELDSVTRSHDVFVSERLSLDELGKGERPFLQFSISERLSIQESVKITPEAGDDLSEATRSLFGSPQGQVFFSPALVSGLPAQSTIQVDKVSVCTRTSDVYTLPKELDPLPLYTYGGGITGNLAGSVISSAVVLFGGFNVIGGGVKTDVALSRKETLPRPVDLEASFVLTQTYDPARFSLLNNPTWRLFDNVNQTFVVADNLNPVGAPVIILDGVYFINPGENLTLTENTLVTTSHLVSVAETVYQSVDEVNFPGTNLYYAPVSETLTLSEGILVAP